MTGRRPPSAASHRGPAIFWWAKRPYTLRALNFLARPPPGGRAREQTGSDRPNRKESP